MSYLDELKKKGSTLVSNLNKSVQKYNSKVIMLTDKGNEARNQPSHIGSLYYVPIIDKNTHIVYPIRNYMQISIMTPNPKDENGSKPYLYLPRIILDKETFANPLTQEENDILEEVVAKAWELAQARGQSDIFRYSAYVMKAFIEKLQTKSQDLYSCQKEVTPEPMLVVHRGQGFLTSIRSVIEYQVEKKKENWLEKIIPNGFVKSIFKTETKLNGIKYDISTMLDTDYESDLFINTEDWVKACEETDLRKEYIDITFFDKNYYTNLIKEIDESIAYLNSDAIEDLDANGMSAPTDVNEPVEANAEEPAETQAPAKEVAKGGPVDVLVGEGYDQAEVEKLLAAGLNLDQIRTVAKKQ